MSSRRQFLGAAAALAALRRGDDGNQDDTVVVETLTEDTYAEVGLGPIFGQAGVAHPGYQDGEVQIAYGRQSITIEVELRIEEGWVGALACLQPAQARQLAGAIRRQQTVEFSTEGTGAFELAGVLADTALDWKSTTVSLVQDSETAVVEIAVDGDGLLVAPGVYTAYPEGTETGEQVAVALETAAAEWQAWEEAQR